MCVATAFCRANSTHPFRTSILPLTSIIAAMACAKNPEEAPLEVARPLKKEEEGVNVDAFMSTRFFLDHASAERMPSKRTKRRAVDLV